MAPSAATLCAQLLLAVGCLALGCLTLPDLNEPAPEAADELALSGLAAIGRGLSEFFTRPSRLPSYFDFDRFASRFKRHYPDHERLYRQSVFLARCLQVFKARVKARLTDHLARPAQWWRTWAAGTEPAAESLGAGYVHGITKLADRSPNEIKRMFMRGPPVEFRPKGVEVADYLRTLQEEGAGREAADWDLELESRGVEPDAAQAPLSESDARHSIERALELAAADRDLELEAALGDELWGLDGDSLSRGATHEPVDELPWPGAYLNGSLADWKARRPLALPDLNSGPVEWSRGENNAAGRTGSESGATKLYVAPELEADEQGIDWSQHKCFHTVYDQGDKCGKCYVMAATALAEFYKCTEEANVISLRKFSKDYVLDCGQKFAPTLLGCTGGSLYDSLRFISRAGMHNIRGWAARRQKERSRLRARKCAHLDLARPLDFKCPLSEFDTDLARWGDIRVGVEPELVAPSDLVEALRDGPLVVAVQMPDAGLETYAGGVHDGQGCATSGNWHAMLLVGFGRASDSTPFWRFRNSWGPNWGDAGHFELAMSVPADCISGGVRVYRSAK